MAIEREQEFSPEEIITEHDDGVFVPDGRDVVTELTGLPSSIQVNIRSQPHDGVSLPASFNTDMEIATTAETPLSAQVATTPDPSIRQPDFMDLEPHKQVENYDMFSPQEKQLISALVRGGLVTRNDLITAVLGNVDEKVGYKQIAKIINRTKNKLTPQGKTITLLTSLESGVHGFKLYDLYGEKPKELPLTYLQAKLIGLLAGNNGMTHSQIIHKIWGEDVQEDFGTRNLSVLIRNLQPALRNSGKVVSHADDSDIHDSRYYLADLDPIITPEENAFVVEEKVEQEKKEVFKSPNIVPDQITQVRNVPAQNVRDATFMNRLKHRLIAKARR